MSSGEGREGRSWGHEPRRTPGAPRVPWRALKDADWRGIAINGSVHTL